MHKRIHTYIPKYTHTHTHIRTYIHTCMHAYIHTHMHTYMLACIHAYMHTRTHTCIHTHILTYMHTYMLACIHTYMHTRTHTYRHTYIHTRRLFIARKVHRTALIWEFILDKSLGYSYNAINSLEKSFVCLCQHLSVGLTGVLAKDGRMYLSRVFCHSDLCYSFVFSAKMCSLWTGE